MILYYREVFKTGKFTIIYQNFLLYSFGSILISYVQRQMERDFLIIAADFEKHGKDLSFRYDSLNTAAMILFGLNYDEWLECLG